MYPNSKSVTKLAPSFAFAVWALLVVAFYIGLLLHDQTPTRAASIQGSVSQAIEHLSHIREDRSNLVGSLHLIMGVHPKCPCTYSSLVALDRLLREVRTPVRCTFVVIQPTATFEDWQDTPTIRFARKISNAQVVLDRDGSLAAQFGFETSGEILIANRSNEILFCGGLTASRSCPDENPNYYAARKAIAESCSVSMNSLVFGCPLQSNTR